MENNEYVTPHGQYDEQLLTTNGIKFTHREIDVMSCIFHMRGSSKIASLLSISTRTVETHTANIMRKMDTNSREGIIDFLQKQGHSGRIQKHYRGLLLQINFRKILLKIHGLIKNKSFGCSIISDVKREDERLFVEALREHLALCGIRCALVDRKDDPSGGIQTLASGEHLVHVLVNQDSTGVREKLTSLLKFSQTSPSYLSNVSYICYNTNPTNIPQDVSMDNFIFIENEDDYYASFFKLIKRILPSIALDGIVASFATAHESTLNDLENKRNQVNTLSKKANGKSLIAKVGLPKNILARIGIIALLSLGFVFLSFYKGGDFMKIDPQNNRSIRSDLIVPADNTFLARSNIMLKIDEGLKGKGGIQVVAIVGIGGAGKSTIARRYAALQKFPVVWEINAATRETIMYSFERLAYALCQTEEEKNSLQGLQNLKNNVERDEKIILFVKAGLKSNSNWFLIYDNVEKFTSIRKYFPLDSEVWGNGKVIITTSNSNTKNNSLINHYIQIGELSLEEKFQLFVRIMSNENSKPFTPTQEEEIKLFLNEIPPFPLDVSIAAYYLKSTGIGYEKYLERLKEDNKDFESIQADVVREASGYTKTRYNIITLPIIELIGTHKDFQDLLLMVSLLDYQKIPNDLLSSFKGEAAVDNFIYSLKKYTLITRESSENSIPTFSLHKSTQEIISAYLGKTLTLTKESPLIHSIGNSLENSVVQAIDDEDFSKMKILAPHCEVFLKHHALLSEPMKSSIGGALGCLYYYLWDKSKAKYLLETNLENLNLYYDQSQDKIARLLVYLGNFYRSVGNYEKAKQLMTRSLVIYKKNPNYLGNAKALGYLGVVYRDLGEYKKAEELLQQSLAVHEKNSKNDIAHAWILAQLGNIYIILGDYPQAGQLLEKSLAIYKLQSEDYVGVSWVLGRLGILYNLGGDSAKAISTLKQSLLITKKYFPDDHIFVARSLAALGSVYTYQGDLQMAKKLLQESLAVYKINYGIDHNETAHVQRLLGQVYSGEGDMDTAEDLFNNSLLIFQKKKNPESYMVLENLADLYLKKAVLAKAEGDDKQEQSFNLEAMNYLNQTLDILKEFFESDSPHIIKLNSKLTALVPLTSNP
jgi:tetratricopeptide (TPR) repeat protein/DNA-binding CsgD family transcriptional regulator